MKVSMTSRIACLIVFILAVITGQSAGQERTTRFVSLDFPNAKNTLAFDINAAGDIVGGYDDANNIGHGFLLRNGRFSTIDYPGASWTQARAISAQGHIVGVYNLPNQNVARSFMLVQGKFYPIDVTGQAHPSPSTYVLRISSTGTIIGCYHINNAAGGSDASTMYGFTLTKDGYSTFEMVRTMHNGINSRGDISGSYVGAGVPMQSYMIRDGEFSWYSFPNAFATVTMNINDSGAVVGWYRDQAKVLHGFLEVRGEFTTIDVDSPGASMTQPYGINAAGDIVGTYVDSTGSHGFLLTAKRQD